MVGTSISVMTLPELVQREEMAEQLRTWWENHEGFKPTPQFIEDRIEHFYTLYDNLIKDKEKKGE
jgi:hypothetical protein